MGCDQLQQRLRNASQDHHYPRNGSDCSSRNTNNRNRNQYMDEPKDTDSGSVPTDPSPRITRAVACEQWYLLKRYLNIHCLAIVRMDAINHLYKGKSWEASSTVSGKNSFFHAAFGVRNNENEPYLDKRVKYRRSRWGTFLNYFENETMPLCLVDNLKKCLSANEKYEHISIEDQDHFEGYVLDIIKAEHDVTIEEIHILATLENVRVVLFKDGPSEPAVIISPTMEVLGNYPHREEFKGEVVLYMEGNIFSRMNSLFKDSVQKLTGNENEIIDVKTADDTGSGLIKYKKGGSAGSEGIQFQVGLLTVFFLNALKKLRNWKLSTENKAAGKFDDVVMEYPEGATLLQAKYKQNKTKKISFEELLSTNSKSDDFSIPKYFLSYEEIKKSFKLKKVIICTNACVDGKAMKFLMPLKIDPESLLHYENCDCKYYTFNDEILPHLIENVKSYYENNFQKRGVDESVITDENLKQFLGHLQLYFSYPPENDIGKITEQLLTHMKHLENVYVDISPSDIYTKLLYWFQQKDGVYINELYAKTIFSEIWRDKHWQRLEKYNVIVECNDLNFQISKRLTHFITKGRYLLQEIKILQILQSTKTKFLFANTDEGADKQKQVIEAFGMPQYTILVLVWDKFVQKSVIKEATSKLKEILDKFAYKKVVLLADDNNKIPQLIGLSCDNYDVINESITIRDLSKDSLKGLLTKENIMFQGSYICLKELLAMHAMEDYAKFLSTEELERLIKDEKIKVGAPVLKLDDHIREFYIKRTFKRKGNIFSEELICEMNEKVVLISDNAGTGKSTVLTNLSVTMKKRYPYLWVVRINLNDYTQILKEFLRKNKETINIFELLNFKHSSKITNQLEQAVFSMSKNVVVMLDGFDEISPDYTQLVLSLLSFSLEQQNLAKLIVTTRPHVAQKLQEKLQVDPFILEPFTEQNQIDFLTGFWMHNLDVDHSERGKCEEYAKALIDKMSSWVQLFEQGTKHFAAIPLHVRMLAEVFQENNQIGTSDEWKGCREYLATSRVELKLPVNMNVTRLYELFIEKKRSVFIDKGNPFGNTVATPALMEQFEECLAYHRSLALELILNKTQCKLFSCRRQTSRNVEMNILKIGIVQKTDDEFHFIHRTFAEYFVAESLIEELQLPNENVDFQKFLIEEILLKPQFVIQAFFDNFLQQVVDDKNQCLSYKITSFDAYKCNLLNDIVRNGNLTIFQLILKCIDLNCFTITPEDPMQSFESPVGGSILKYSNILKFLQQKVLDVQSMLMPDTFLEFAAAGGHLEMVKFLVGQGAKINIHNFRPLHLAVNQGHFEVSKFLVEQGADVFSKDRYYRTTVFYKAVSRNDIAMATYLLDKILQSGGLNITDAIIPYLAAYLGKLDILEKVMKQGLDVSDRADNNETVIFAAVRGTQLETIRYLVQQRCDINSTDYRNNTVLHLTSQERSLLSIAKLLVELGIDVNLKNFEFSTALHIATEENNFDLSELLVNHHANVNLGNRKGATALHIAVEKNNVDLVELLVNREANVNLADVEGTTALHIAVEENNFELVKLLMHRGANINFADEEGTTALHIAVKQKNFDLIELLVNSGVDVNLGNRKKATALHIAVEGNNLDLVELLVNHGADVNLATEENNFDIIELLVNHDGNVNLRNRKRTTVVHIAVEKNNLDLVELLVNRGANVNFADVEGITALHIAVEENNFDMTELLVNHGADVNLENVRGNTALHVAVQNHQENIVRLLVRHGANVNSKNENGSTALYLAIEQCLIHLEKNKCQYVKNLDIIKFLIESDINVNIQNCNGSTVLHLATKVGKLDIIILLVESQINVDITDNRGQTALHLAALQGHIHIVKFLVQHNADCNIRDNDGQTVFHYLVNFNHRENDKYNTIRLAVENGGDVNLQDNDGRTVLHLATNWGNLEAVNLFVEVGGDVNIRDADGRTGLHIAAKEGHFNIVQYLLNNGVDVTIGDNSGYTALHLAVDKHKLYYFVPVFDTNKNYLDIVEIIVANCKEVIDIEDKTRCTALHLAALQNRIEIVKSLVRHGANVNNRNVDGCTALHGVARKGHVEITKFLLENGVNVDIRDNESSTPLHLAAENDSIDVAVHLVEFGVDLNARDKMSNTALHKAVNKGCLNVVKYLVEAGIDIKIKNNHGYTALHLAAKGMGSDTKNDSSQCSAIKECAEINNINDTDYSTSDEESSIDTDFSDSDLGLINDEVFIRFNLDIVITLLTRCNKTANIKDASGHTGLHLAVLEGNLEVVEVLVKHNVDVNIKNNSGRSALQLAVDYGKLEIAKLLVECGANISDQDSTIDWVITGSKHRTVLHLAAESGKLDTVGFFTELGIDVNVTDDEGYTPLQLALDGGYLRIVKYLAEKGADITRIDNYEALVMHLAVKAGDLNMMAFFMKHCTDINATDKTGNTALHSAVRKNSLDIVKCLVNFGINVNVKNSKGWTALHLASDRGCLDIANFLVDHGANLNFPDYGGSTALHLACWNLNFVTFLVERGADINLKDSNGDTAVIVAERNGYIEVFQYLGKELFKNQTFVT